MKLGKNVSIVFEYKTITNEVLKIDRRKWSPYTLSSRLGEPDVSDEECLRILFYEKNTIPLIINGKDKKQLILEASFKKFPYTIDGKTNFADFSLRLIPIQNCIKSVIVEKSFISLCPLISSDCIIVDVPYTHLEIFFHFIKKKEYLAPPAEFRKRWITKDRLPIG